MLICIAAVLFLTACPNELVPFDSQVVNQVKDEIAPVISITYPEDNCAYSKTILITGTASDSMTILGDTGKVVSIKYEILGTALSGTVVPASEGGGFSFLIQSSSFTGNNITINLTAEDQNGNKTIETLNLIYQNSDIDSFSILPGNGSASLSWAIPPETTEFRLNNILSGETRVLDASAESYSWNGLANGDLAFFQLTAEDSFGNSNVSEIVSSMPMSPYTLCPEVYGSLEGVSISWPELKDAIRYVVERSESRDGTYEIKFITAATEAVDTSLISPDKAYYYRVYPEGYETVKSDAVRIKPLSYYEGWTIAETARYNYSESFIYRENAVYSKEGSAYFYSFYDSTRVECVVMDSAGNMSSLGILIDSDDFSGEDLCTLKVDQANDLLFLTTGIYGLFVFDISDPGSPVIQNSGVGELFGLTEATLFDIVLQKYGGSNYLYARTEHEVVSLKYNSDGQRIITDRKNFGADITIGSLFLDDVNKVFYASYKNDASGSESEGFYYSNVSLPSGWDNFTACEHNDGSRDSGRGMASNGIYAALLKDDCVEIFDIASGSSFVRKIDLSGDPRKIEITGNFLLIPSESRGVQIINLETQVQSLIGQFQTSDLAVDVVSFGSRLFAVTSSCIEEFSIRVPNDFIVSSKYTGSGGTDLSYKGGVVADDTLLLGRQDSSTIISCDIWDVSSASPASASQVFTPKGHSFAVQGSRLAVSNTYNSPEIGLYMNTVSGGNVDTEYSGTEGFNYMAFQGERLFGASKQKISLFESPSAEVVGSSSFAMLDEEIVGDLSFKDEYIYVPMGKSGGLAVFEIEDDLQMNLINTVQSSVFSTGTRVSLYDSLTIGDYLYVLYDDPGLSVKMTGVVVFSLSDPAAPVVISRYDYSYLTLGNQCAMGKFTVSGHLLFCITSVLGTGAYTSPGSGIVMLDVSDPSGIFEVNKIDLDAVCESGFQDLLVDGNDLYVIEFRGLYKVDF